MHRLLITIIALISFLAAAASTAQEPQRIALLIGNQKYDSSVGALKNPHNDIALVGAALRKQGFTVLPLVHDARRTTILGGVRELVRRLNGAGAGAVGFIYYSGHGAAEKDTRINYLIPVDASEPGSAQFWDASVKLDDILRLLEGARNAAKFVVFDACRNELQLRERTSDKGLIPVSEHQGMFIAYATAPGRTASDRGATSGPYAAALAAELDKPGLDHLNLFQNVKETVLASTGGAQQPWESNGLGRRVMLTPQPKVMPAKAGETGTTASPGTGAVDAAERAWGLVRDSRNPAVLETFAKQFPGTVHAALAQERLTDLQHAAQAAKTQAEQQRAEQQRLAMLQKEEGDRKRVEAEAKRRDDEEAARGVPQVGRTFRDCPACPEMVVVPAGSFTMGSPASEPDRSADEGPQRKVTIARPFAAGRFEVTFAELDACVAGGGCNSIPFDQGWGRGKRPVINVSWDDAKEYVAWLSRKTGATYRLLTEAEWEYAARAGTTRLFSTGPTITAAQANFDGNVTYGGSAKGQYRQRTIDVGSFKPNAFGLYDMHGNVSEWVEDCYVNTYAGAPTDGSFIAAPSCSDRVLRGGSWDNDAQFLRAANRNSNQPGSRLFTNGFRLARTLIHTP